MSVYSFNVSRHNVFAVNKSSEILFMSHSSSMKKITKNIWMQKSSVLWFLKCVWEFSRTRRGQDQCWQHHRVAYLRVAAALRSQQAHLRGGPHVCRGRLWCGILMRRYLALKRRNRWNSSIWTRGWKKTQLFWWWWWWGGKVTPV